MTSTIDVKIESAIGIITLNRPDKLNSFNIQMHEELQQALDSLTDNSTVRSILLTGAGRGFCAGQDLSDRTVTASKELPNLGQSVEKFYNPLIRRITHNPKPIICAVNGVAAGAGASIALACDLVIAAKSASFVLAFANIGLIPDSGCSWHLPHNIGLARAKAFALLGERATADQVKEWGLIWQVSEDTDLMVNALTLAKRLADQPPLAMKKTKELMNNAFQHSLDEHIEKERLAMQMLGKTNDYQEGVSAFMEKRNPVYQGN